MHSGSFHTQKKKNCITYGESQALSTLREPPKEKQAKTSKHAHVNEQKRNLKKKQTHSRENRKATAITNKKLKYSIPSDACSTYTQARLSFGLEFPEESYTSLHQSVNAIKKRS